MPHVNGLTGSGKQMNTYKLLQDLVNEQRIIVESLSLLEQQIYNYETRYLEDTCEYGNIIKGWDGFISTSNTVRDGDGAGQDGSLSHSGQGDKQHRNRKFRESDRLFSRSSVTSQASLYKHSENKIGKPALAGATAGGGTHLSGKSHTRDSDGGPLLKKKKQQQQ